jgi:hypothetical protein
MALWITNAFCFWTSCFTRENSNLLSCIFYKCKESTSRWIFHAFNTTLLTCSNFKPNLTVRVRGSVRIWERIRINSTCLLCQSPSLLQRRKRIK